MLGGAAAALAALIFFSSSPCRSTTKRFSRRERFSHWCSGRCRRSSESSCFCGAGLILGQHPFFLNLEVLIVCVARTGTCFVTTVRNFATTTYASPCIILLLAAAASLPAVIGGISILAGVGGCRYWLAFGFAAGTIAASYHAWILLIVIRR